MKDFKPEFRLKKKFDRVKTCVLAHFRKVAKKKTLQPGI